MKITGAKILGPDFIFRAQTIEIHEDTISALTPASPQDASCGEAAYVGLKMIPGLIDVHMHGYYGHSCNTESPEDLIQISQNLVKEGVTGFAAGISTAPVERTISAIRSCRRAADQMKEEKPAGAELLAVHLEGPFLNPQKKGAMDERYIRLPSAALLASYLEEGGDLIRLMTLAPEMEDAADVIEYGCRHGVGMSMGHTMATREQALAGVQQGISRATHTFNAMRPLDHRESGVLGVALLDERVECEMIADFVHLKPEICELIYRLKGADRITLISDSCQLAGLRQEQLPKDLPIVIRDAAYLPNGTLCGSISTVMTAVRNLVSIGIPLENAVKMASFNPARDLRLDHQLGSLAPGKRANFVLIDDDLRVHAVYVKGRLVYHG